MRHYSAFFEARLVIHAEQSRYSKSKVARLLEGAGIKKSNMPHGIILPTSFITTYPCHIIKAFFNLKIENTGLLFHFLLLNVWIFHIVCLTVSKVSNGMVYPYVPTAMQGQHDGHMPVHTVTYGGFSKGVWKLP
jgi:hypothetical protein